jgi:hypothetical protein
MHMNNHHHLVARKDIYNRSDNAILTANIRSLYVLWQEYASGIGGKKTAKDFTLAEKKEGKSKCTYSCCKIAWGKIQELIFPGHTANVAINRFTRHTELGLRSPASSIQFGRIGKNREIAASSSKAQHSSSLAY